MQGFFDDKNKEYIAVMKLGIETDTQDTTGTILDKREVHVSEEEILKTIFEQYYPSSCIDETIIYLYSNSFSKKSSLNSGFETLSKASSLVICPVKIKLEKWARRFWKPNFFGNQ